MADISGLKITIDGQEGKASTKSHSEIKADLFKAIDNENIVGIISKRNIRACLSGELVDLRAKNKILYESEDVLKNEHIRENTLVMVEIAKILLSL